MESKELRLNNWVLEQGHYGQIKDLNEYTGCYFDPIPITEELLMKCGFERFTPIGQYYNGLKMLTWFRGNGLVVYKSFGPNAPYGGITIDNFKNPISGEKTELAYLHQLQNLYFALTGKELENNL